MTSGRATTRLSQLWQFPLLLVALGLFGFAAYRFIDPKPKRTLSQKLEAARQPLQSEMPEAALAPLNALLATPGLPRDAEATVRLSLAEAIDAAQRRKHLDLTTNHRQIVQQTELAAKLGAKLDAEAFRRIGRSQEALEQPLAALTSYVKALSLQPNADPAFRRKVIELQIEAKDPQAAAESLDWYLRAEKLPVTERVWAMGQKGRLLADAGEFAKAKAILTEAQSLSPSAAALGAVNNQLGYCLWKLGAIDEADRTLRLAREQLGVSDPIEADAAYILGRIQQTKDNHREAIACFESILISHPDAPVALLAKLGRGVSRLALRDDESGLSDLHEVTTALDDRPARQKYKPDAIAALKESSTLLAKRGNHQGALELLAYEQSLQEKPPADFYGRLAMVYADRAKQAEASLASLPDDAARQKVAEQARNDRMKAGDAYMAHAKAVTSQDDKAYGESIWKAADLYDRAGDLPSEISALDLFANERPSDGLAPDSLLRLGRTYQAMGETDKAIAAYQRNQFRYPQSLAASKSGVPLALAYLSKVPAEYAKAEKVLLAVITDNPLITPEAEEFHQALVELANLYYRTDRFELAIARFEETTQRYTDDVRRGQLIYLMADSYRQSARRLKDVAATQPATQPLEQLASALDSLPNPEEATAARRDRLKKAEMVYALAIESLRAAAAPTDIDRLYLKLAHFYRADCLYELGDYAAAIRQYDAAALHYQGDPATLAAYVQIVNAYCELGRFEEAKRINERAKVLLRSMPKEAFDPTRFALSKDAWERWLKWTNDVGMF